MPLRGPASGPRAVFFAVLLVGMAACGGVLLRGVMPAGAIALLYVPVILFDALLCDLPALVVGCLGSLISYNVLFLPPVYAFTPASPENVPVLAVFVIVGMTVRQVAGRMRREAVKTREVEARERLQAALLASVSHDLRTPLASILGSASVLKLHGRALEPAAAASLVETIEDEAANLNRLIGNLLDMTRLEAGALKLRWVMIDLADVMGSALRRVEAMLPAARVRLELAPELPDMLLDPVLLEQILFNLLDNAAKYGAPDSEVRVAARRAGECVVISIANEGAILPGVELERIFEKFHRLSPNGGPAGSGLGLPICRGFVEALGGRIAAANHESGAVFTIMLPVSA